VQVSITIDDYSPLFNPLKNPHPSLNEVNKMLSHPGETAPFIG
jgi:hypothetical protein